MSLTRRIYRQTIRPALRRYLEVGETDAGDVGEPDAFALFCLRRDEVTLRALWAQHRAEILGDWIDHAPGTRPRAWWRFDAPELRRRLGGIGTPKHEALAYAPTYAYGIPVYWVDASEVAYYTGRAVDVHGDPIGQEFAGRTFRGAAINPDDPPRFESEATYLDRHTLLTAAERSELDDDAFTPEAAGLWPIEADQTEYHQRKGLDR